MGEWRGAYTVLVGKPEGKNNLEDLGVNEMIILKCTFKQCVSGGRAMDWTDLADDRDRWLAFVNAVLNLQVPYNVGNFSTI
jgi:hypothetical protein